MRKFVAISMRYAASFVRGWEKREAAKLREAEHVADLPWHKHRVALPHRPRVNDDNRQLHGFLGHGYSSLEKRKRGDFAGRHASNVSPLPAERATHVSSFSFSRNWS